VTAEATSRAPAGEASFRLLAEHLPDLVLLAFDPELRIWAATGAALRARGWTPGDFVGRRVPAVGRPDDELTFSDELCRILGLEPDVEATMESAIARLLHPADLERTAALLGRMCEAPPHHRPAAASGAGRGRPGGRPARGGQVGLQPGRPGRLRAHLGAGRAAGPGGGDGPVPGRPAGPGQRGRPRRGDPCAGRDRVCRDRRGPAGHRRRPWLRPRPRAGHRRHRPLRPDRHAGTGRGPGRPLPPRPGDGGRGQAALSDPAEWRWGP
jgi:hypothetical protein